MFKATLHSGAIADANLHNMLGDVYRQEVVPQLEFMPGSKSSAYSKRMCAVVEHWSEPAETRRARVASAQLNMQARHCDYVCELDDDLVGAHTSPVFRHAPERPSHWDLLVRAVCWTNARQGQSPERSALHVAPSFDHRGPSHIGLGKLRQPACAGLKQWLDRKGTHLKADLPAR